MRDYLINQSIFSKVASNDNCVENLLMQQYEIKTNLLNWINQNMVLMSNPSVAASDIPFFIISNVASILSLLVKSTYPEYWPTAFSDMLSIGKQNTYTLNLVLQFLNNIILDIVDFNESRNKVEVNHNALIKDSMRSTTVTLDVVDFLYTYVDHLYQQYRLNPLMNHQSLNIIDKVLKCFSSYIGWIDIFIVIRSHIIAMLNTCMTIKQLVNSSCLCYIEIVKRGMSSHDKVKLINQVQVITCLTDILNSRIEKNQNSSVIDELFDELYDDQYAVLADTLFQILINIWSEYEQIKLTPLNSARSIGSNSNGNNTPVKRNNSIQSNIIYTHIKPSISNPNFTTLVPSNCNSAATSPVRNKSSLSLNISSALSLNLPNESNKNEFSMVSARDEEISELSSMAETLAKNLKAMMKIILYLFQQKYYKLYSIVIPSINKVILHYKYQLNKNREIHNFIQDSSSKKMSIKGIPISGYISHEVCNNTNTAYEYYESEIYINDIFLIIYKQLQITTEEFVILNSFVNIEIEDNTMNK